MATRNDLKIWFDTGKKPTGSQFAALIDTFLSLSEDTITIAMVNGLSALLAGKASAADIASLTAVKVDKIAGKGLSTEDYTTAEKAKLGTLVEHYRGKYTTLSILQTAVPVGNDGDYAIVEGSPDSQEYIWDSAGNEWVLTANIPAGTFAGLGGNPSDNAALNAVLTGMVTDRVNGDAALQTQISALSAALIPHPTYTPPSIPLTSTQTTAGLEIGQTINIPLTVGFNQNDGGAEGAISLKKDGAQIATTATFTDNGVVMSLTPKVYQANVAYAQGPVKNNLIGVADPTGRINAGSANSNALSYVGNYKIWFGATDTVIDASNIRTILGFVMFSSGTTNNFQSGATYKNFYIWVPTGKTLTSWVDSNTNADLKAASTNSSLTIPDAGAGTLAGTLYKVSAGSPFPGPTGDLFKFVIS